MRNALSLLAVTVGLSIGVAGCGGGGGGGGDSAPPLNTSTAEGLYSGSTSNGRSVTGLVLEDGTLYFLYSAVGNSSVIGGVAQGNGTSTGTTFTSNNTVDFNLEGLGVLPASVSANYVPKQSINGTVSYSGSGVVSFSGSYDSLYDATPSLTALAGIFTGQVASSAGQEAAIVTVQPDGTVTGTGSSGCGFTGAVTPRARGNVFYVAVSFGGAPCLFANQTLSGVAFFDPNTKQLYAAAPNATRTSGVLFVGTKP
jgi:hypothetical protein